MFFFIKKIEQKFYIKKSYNRKKVIKKIKNSEEKSMFFFVNFKIFVESIFLNLHVFLYVFLIFFKRLIFFLLLIFLQNS